MATTERKYKGALTLGKLEQVLEAQEALFGTLTKVEALGGQTVGTYDDVDFPALNSLALLPTIGDSAPPAPAGATPLLTGSATILGAPIGVTVYRTG